MMCVWVAGFPERLMVCMWIWLFDGWHMWLLEWLIDLVVYAFGQLVACIDGLAVLWLLPLVCWGRFGDTWNPIFTIILSDYELAN